MSLSFAMSAFGSSKGGQSDYSNKSVNAKQLLMDIGVPEANIRQMIGSRKSLPPIPLVLL